MKQAVKERAVFEKEIPEVFVNGKNTVAMGGLDELESHAGRAFHGIFDATGRAEAAVASEGNEFQVTAMGTGIHGTAKGRIATVDHLINVFHFRFSGMEGIFNFFVIVGKNFL